MFKKLVSNLSFSPGASSQLAYYLRRLKKEQITRRISAIAGVMVFGLQLVAVAAPPDATNASSTNDIIFGGLISRDPKGDVLAVYDNDRDSAGHTGYRALFKYFNISRDDLARTTQTTINSSDRSLLSLGRNRHFAADKAIDLTSVSPPPSQSANPYGCPSHPQIKQGASGGCVKHLQWYLNHRAGASLAEDGAFGPLTNTAVRNFQSSRGLAVDGIVGPNTWGALHSSPARLAPGAYVYYQRPLHLWDRAGNKSYQALAGRRRDGSPFYIMLGCGNIVVKEMPPPPPPAPTPPPAPKPPQPAPVPPTPTSPNLQLSKTAVYTGKSAADGRALNADSTTAQAGDLIAYTLTTANTGTGAKKGHIVREDIADILEYADVVNVGGGTLAGGTLTWPKLDIAAGTSAVNNFTVKVKNPIPVTPRSASDPLSFDLRMDNVYGPDEVRIDLSIPPVKQVEVASATLPETGAASNLAVMGGFIGLVIYFYMRNRQLVHEIRILRVDHNPGVSQ